MDGVRVDDEGFKRLEDDFKPSVLEKKCMTTKDDQIHETNVPKWFQFYKEIMCSWNQSGKIVVQWYDKLPCNEYEVTN